MGRNILKLVIMFCFGAASLQSHAQNETRKATFYLKDGARVTGSIKGSFFNKQRLRLYDEKGSTAISVSKVDSIITDSALYVVRSAGMSKYLSSVRVDGDLELHQLNRKILAIKRSDTPFYNIPKKKYGRAYSVFCLNYLDTSKGEISTEEFIRLVEECNTNGQYKEKVLYDSLKLGLERFVVRLSVFRPHAGFELRLLKNVTVFNSVGVNFFGDYFREATTVINYDYVGQLRWYYLYNNRLKKGKSNYKHSGQYITASYHYFIDVNSYNANVLSLQHGWQDNNLFNRVASSTAFGLGVDPLTTDIYVIVDFKFGIAF